MNPETIRMASAALKQVEASPAGRVMRPKALTALRKAVDKATTPPAKATRNK